MTELLTQMEQLVEQKKMYEKEIKYITGKVRELEKEIKILQEKIFPQCSSCGRHVATGWIATHNDIHEYTVIAIS